MSAMVRAVLTLGFTIALLPRLALAAPLNPFDPTLRTVLVEFEISNGPGVLDTTYSVPVSASYSATGSTGTLSMPGAAYESVAQLFDSFGFPLIPSSSEDFVVAIDLITLGASVQTLTYQVDIDVQVAPRQIGTITRRLGSEVVAGFVFVSFVPGIPVFCTQDPPAPFPPCTLIPGSAYDPATGSLNAVGSDALVAPDITFTSFSTAGELRVTEVPVPATALLLAGGILGLALCAGPGRPRRIRLLRGQTQRGPLRQPESACAD